MTLRNIAASMRHLRARRAAVAAGNVFACAGLVGFIACSDSGITEPAAPRAAAVSRPNADLAATGGSWTQDFTYTPSTGTTVTFQGGAKVILPPKSVCDPNSGYGATLWNSKCPAATSPITFHVAASTTSSGDIQVTVSPDMRFVPGPIAQVYLPALNGATSAPVIQWCTAQMTNCVDEGTTDKAMVTFYDAASRLAHRRIKHFSGYNVGYGKTGGVAPAATN